MVVLIMPNQEGYSINLISEHLLEITLDKADEDIPHNWTKSNYNWNQIFEDIKNFG